MEMVAYISISEQNNYNYEEKSTLIFFLVPILAGF